jgi:predicted lactoylglutathione lyase
LERNLANQTAIYEKASDAKTSIKVIVYFSAAERKRVEGILKKLKLAGDRDVILVDARKDNKPSGSKA